MSSSFFPKNNNKNKCSGGGSSIQKPKADEYWRERLPNGIIKRFGQCALSIEEQKNGLLIRSKIFGHNNSSIHSMSRQNSHRSNGNNDEREVDGERRHRSINTTSTRDDNDRDIGPLDLILRLCDLVGIRLAPRSLRHLKQR